VSNGTDVNRERNGSQSVSLVINRTYTSKGIPSSYEWSTIDTRIRQVSAEDGRRLSEEWNCAWTEASARNNENVSKAFELVIGQVEKQFAPPAEERGKCIIS